MFRTTLIATLLLGLGVLAFPRLLRADSDLLSLNEAQAEARSHSPILRRLEAAKDSSNWKVLEEASPYIPHLSVDGSQILEQKYEYLDVYFGGDFNFPSAFPSSQLNLNVEDTLFDGFSAWQRYRAAANDRDASKLELEDAAFKLDEGVALAFYRALASKLLSGVADQNIETLESHLQNVTASAESGMATQFDVLRVQSKLEEANAEKLLENDNETLARAKLLEAMGLPGPDDRELSGDLPVPDASLVSALDLSPSARTDLKAELTRIQSARDSAGAAWSDWFPRLSVYGQQSYYKYNSYDPVIIASDTYQPAYNVGLNLNWDLFDGGRTLAKAKEEGAKADAAQAGYDKDLLKAGEDIDDWRRRYLYNAALYAARQRSLEENEEAVRLADLGLQAGTRSHSESLDAESDLFAARAGLVQAQMDALEARLNLELSLGHALGAQP